MSHSTVDAVVSNFVRAWTTLGSRLPGTTGRGDGYAWLRTGRGVFLDAIYLTGTAHTTPIETAVEELGGGAGSVWVLPGASDWNLDTLGSLGFTEIDGWPAMARQLVAAQPIDTAPTSWAVHRVADAETFERLLPVATVVNGDGALQEAYVAATREIGFDPDADVSHFVAEADGEPVACATLLMGPGDVAGIYSVATVEHLRGRGLGRAVTVAALEAGRDRGATIGVLQTSPAGRPVYERLGFRDVAPFRHFLRMAPPG